MTILFYASLFFVVRIMHIIYFDIRVEVYLYILFVCLFIYPFWLLMLDKIHVLFCCLHNLLNVDLFIPMWIFSSVIVLHRRFLFFSLFFFLFLFLLSLLLFALLWFGGFFCCCCSVWNSLTQLNKVAWNSLHCLALASQVLCVYSYEPPCMFSCSFLRFISYVLLFIFLSHYDVCFHFSVFFNLWNMVSQWNPSRS